MFVPDGQQPMQYSTLSTERYADSETESTCSTMQPPPLPNPPGGRCSFQRLRWWCQAELVPALCSPGLPVVVLFVAFTLWVSSQVVLNVRPLPGELLELEDGQRLWVPDPEVDIPLAAEQTVNDAGLKFVGFVLPWLLAALVKLATPCIPGDLRAFAYGFTSATASSEMFTSLAKRYVGRLRPAFYSLCDFKTATLECTRDPIDARMSFPSGHSSLSMVSMLYCSLYLLGKLRPASQPGAIKLPGGLGVLHWKPAAAVLATSPVWLACWVATSRLHDNWHHPADVVAGMLLGGTVAVFWYSVGFHSPFDPSRSHLPIVGASMPMQTAGPVELPTETAVELGASASPPVKANGEHTPLNNNGWK